MAVYVDDMKAKYGRMVMCHMIADTTEELLAMADKIGVHRRWIQRAGTPYEHFDVALSSRAKAVEAGAIEITQMEVGRKIRDKSLALLDRSTRTKRELAEEFGADFFRAVDETQDPSR